MTGGRARGTRRTEFGAGGRGMHMRPWLRPSPAARLWRLATRSRPVEGNHLSRVLVRWKSSGRALSLALLGGISLTAAAGPMESGSFAIPPAARAAVAPLSAGLCAAAVPPQANRIPPASQSQSQSQSQAFIPALPGGLLAAVPALSIGGVPTGFR